MTSRHSFQKRNRARAHRLLHDCIVPVRVEGLKRATAVCVGEKHSLALQSCWSAPSLLDAVHAPVDGGAGKASIEGWASPNRSFGDGDDEDDEDDCLVLLCEMVRFGSSLYIRTLVPTSRFLNKPPL